MSMIQLSNVNQYFDHNHVLKQVDLEVEEGDFMTFLGPSGCGKTTTLRIISGLEKPRSGMVTIQGKVVDNGDTGFHAPPAARGLSLVFQSYALWPHMTIYDNVAFGLDVKKLPKAEIRQKVEQALEKMRIRELIDRYPSELSGGQQQRVAIARAIVTEPKILLLDEPLSNLDAKLRIEMRTELKRLHRELKTTIIYVTHDQVEALTLSTKIAVFFGGELVQVDKPRDLYRNPGTLQVADFMGNPGVNLIDAACVKDEGVLKTFSDLGQLDFVSESTPNGPVVLALKPEDVQISVLPVEGAIPCKVYSVLPAGSETIIQLQMEELSLLVKTMGDVDYEMDGQVWIQFPQDKINVYDKQTGKIICKSRT